MLNPEPLVTFVQRNAPELSWLTEFFGRNSILYVPADTKDQRGMMLALNVPQKFLIHRTYSGVPAFSENSHMT